MNKHPIWKCNELNIAVQPIITVTLILNITQERWISSKKYYEKRCSKKMKKQNHILSDPLSTQLIHSISLYFKIPLTTESGANHMLIQPRFSRWWFTILRQNQCNLGQILHPWWLLNILPITASSPYLVQMILLLLVFIVGDIFHLVLLQSVNICSSSLFFWMAFFKV